MKSVYPIFTRSDIIFRHTQLKAQRRPEEPQLAHLLSAVRNINALVSTMAFS
jgi:hypothetical protein